MTPEGAHAHVRYLPHRRGHAFDAVVEDSGPGIRPPWRATRVWTNRIRTRRPSGWPCRS